MKRVWKPRSEIRAKTVKTYLKTHVLGSSLSSSPPSAAILVSERSDEIFQIFQFVHIYADFFPPVKLMNNVWGISMGSELRSE